MFFPRPFKNRRDSCTKWTSQMFNSLRFNLQSLVLGSFLVLLRYSFLFFSFISVYLMVFVSIISSYCISIHSVVSHLLIFIINVNNISISWLYILIICIRVSSSFSFSFFFYKYLGIIHIQQTLLSIILDLMSFFYPGVSWQIFTEL